MIVHVGMLLNGIMLVLSQHCWQSGRDGGVVVVDVLSAKILIAVEMIKSNHFSGWLKWLRWWNNRDNHDPGWPRWSRSGGRDSPAWRSDNCHQREGACWRQTSRTAGAVMVVAMRCHNFDHFLLLGSSLSARQWDSVHSWVRHCKAGDHQLTIITIRDFDYSSVLHLRIEKPGFETI